MAHKAAANIAQGSIGITNAKEALSGFCKWSEVVSEGPDGSYMLKCGAVATAVTTHFCCAHYSGEGCSDRIYPYCPGRQEIPQKAIALIVHALI